MCLVLFACRTHPRYPLVVAANRDEFHQRPTRPAHYWDEHPDILGGRDLKQGGTWMAINGKGRLAIVTNYRRPSEKKDELRSRGLLVNEYLTSELAAVQYLAGLSAKVRDYGGFNLFAGDAESLFYFSSYLKAPVEMEPGYHGISNGDLDSPWPKVLRGKAALQEAIENTNDRINTGQLFEILRDREIPVDEMLPDTGIGMELERMLAPAFITGKDYGTRSSTLLIIDNGGNVWFAERSYDAEGNRLKYVEFEFQIE